MKLSELDLSGLPITYRQQIPENYRDEMGHTNVMWYTHLFSMAFDQFGALFGFTREYHEAHGSGSFALETHVRYLSEVLIDRHITIRSRAVGRSAKRLHYMHFMTIDETGALAAIYEGIGAHIDMSVRRMSPMPELLTSRYDALIKQHDAVGWPAPVCGVMHP